MDMAWHWRDIAQHGTAHSMAWQCIAWHEHGMTLAWHGTTRHSMARHTLTHSTQASGPADTIVAADAPGSPDLYECSQCKRKLANGKGAFDKKMQQRIRAKKSRQALLP